MVGWRRESVRHRGLVVVAPVGLLARYELRGICLGLSRNDWALPDPPLQKRWRRVVRVWVRVFLPLLAGWRARPGGHGLSEFMRGGPPPWLLISEPPWARRGAFPSRWRKVDRGAWQRTALARAARLSLIQARVWLEGLHALSPSGAGIWWTCGRGMVARSDSCCVGRDSTRAWHRCADARRTTSLSLSLLRTQRRMKVWMAANATVVRYPAEWPDQKSS